MPRNPANQKKKPEPSNVATKTKPRPALEDGQERSVPEVAAPSPPVQVIERRIETVTVKIPLGEPPHRFDQLHIEGWLRRDAAHTFARLRQALRDQGAKTADGREVKTNPDIMRWLMEQICADFFAKAELHVDH